MNHAALNPTLAFGSEPPSRYRFGDFVLDATRRAIAHRGEPVTTSSTQFDVMLYLVRHPDRIVTKDELLNAVWPTKTVEEGNVSQTIFTLRKALAEAGAKEAIIGTAHGQGYRMVAPVRPFGTPIEVTGSPEVEAPSAASPAAAPEAVRIPRLAVIGAAGAIVMAGVGVVAVSLGGLRFAPPPPPIPVVLADFRNQTGDPVFDATLQRAVRIDLSQSPRMKVLTQGTVASTLELMTKPKDTPQDAALAGEVCTRNGAPAVVDGAIARFGARYLVTVSATDCTGGRTFAEEKEMAADRDAVIPAIDHLSARIRSRLGEAKSSIDQFNMPLMPERTASIDALKALTLANDLSLKGRDTEAIPYFERAIALDPNFTRAYEGFLRLWAHADADTPILVQAKAEYAALGKA